MKKQNHPLFLLATLFLLIGCNKEPLPSEGIVATMERVHDSTTYIYATYADGSEIYFKVLSDQTVEMASMRDYFGEITPPVSNCAAHVVIPSEITHNAHTYTVVGIGRRAFYCCYALTTVEIPETVQYIGTEAFDGCTHLESIQFHEGIRRIGKKAFWCCSALTSVELNEAITFVPEGAFGHCENLAFITLPCVDTIMKEGFAYADGMTSVELPATTKALYTAAFANCRSLTQISCKAVVPPGMLEPFYSGYIETSPFLGCPIEEIRVPEESVEAYKAASGWSSYADKIIGM